ncbi:hypothetical protein DPEC_G00235510 [Dallia pectoralis]|uniref:Uncharacterized protein n=1 Tax=Dallia pectoralis TaxID=75939 RepID=A0ACC2FYI8_DALPE|nr:hypothetical protein DPEC_G00235510 [Dallia pectoralis]
MDLFPIIKLTVFLLILAAEPVINQTTQTKVMGGTLQPITPVAVSVAGPTAYSPTSVTPHVVPTFTPGVPTPNLGVPTLNQGVPPSTPEVRKPTPDRPTPDRPTPEGPKPEGPTPEGPTDISSTPSTAKDLTTLAFGVMSFILALIIFMGVLVIVVSLRDRCSNSAEEDEKRRDSVVSECYFISNGEKESITLVSMRTFNSETDTDSPRVSSVYSTTFDFDEHQPSRDLIDTKLV